MATFRNPILPGFYPDPSVCRVGDRFYLATSTFEYFPGVPIFESTDLFDWRQIGHALTRSEQLPLDGVSSSKGVFAPTLRHHDGVFYLITTNMTAGGNFYVTASDPRGPWSAPVWLPENVIGMDPSLFFDDDGKVYYTGHGGGERGGIYQCELDVHSGKLVAEPQLIWRGTGGIWPEGPHLYKFRGDYYLLIAEGGTSYGHTITIARSQSPWGPFEAHPSNPILTHRHRQGHPIQATGHGDLVQAPDDSTWLVFLGIRPTPSGGHHLGRETFLAPLQWSDGWPTVNAGAAVELEMPAGSWRATDATTSGLAPERDDFDDSALPPHYCFVRNPDPRCWSLSERPGHLRLVANAWTLTDVASPAAAFRRQQRAECRIEAELEFMPQTDEQRAGLVLRADERNHYELCVTRVKGVRVVQLRTTLDGTTTVLDGTPCELNPITLRIDAGADDYEFCALLPDGPHVLGRAPTAPLTPNLSTSFTGAMIGLYATGAGAPAADFDWLALRPRPS